MSSQEPPQAPAPEKVDEAFKESNRKFDAKSKSEYFDPCQEFAQRSIRCLHRNGGDRSMCGDFFQAYKDCKKEWFERRKEERKKNGAWW
ncbi:Cytochrome c oxidase-assembly factor cox-23 [Colletotrichum sidae]|uniref:Cytochrome c oxidase-assembly factor cox-23 n=3 Tax=Colletotrichum orbiculare species complex TaxID=2707354 RepID=N4US57_COLOR|nr:Cytochrome c oxidase-assembly factor cox-23 [Colletotrichum orbiculare MAFF 240422]TDZ36008.1 Cytochrome c oxidase-assembly factor cox-23 [Colletotrichum spinosum]TEA12731.1 Cytochrome c oxidase-assembly factor cox-23 [Colletotrichum sidae]